MTYTIEKGIPIPRKKHDFDFFILGEMSIGDSVIAPLGVRPQLSARGKHFNIELKSKKIDDFNIRIWRTK